MTTLTLRQMRQFLAVAETLNFRKAAERLNMAQPPLTVAVRQMERALGVKLLRRGNRVDGLTEAGEVLRREALLTIRQAERTELLTKRAGAGELGSLSLGFLASAIQHLLPPIIARFRVTHPDVQLDLLEASTAHQVSALMEHRLDVGLVALPLPAGKEVVLRTFPLQRSRFVAALPASHPLAQDEAKLDLAALALDPWVLFPTKEGPGLHSLVVQACARAGFMPNVVQQAVQMETIVGLVASGLGAALVPDVFRTAGRSGVVFRPVVSGGQPVPYEVALAWNGENASRTLRAFLRSAGSDI